MSVCEGWLGRENVATAPACVVLALSRMSFLPCSPEAMKHFGAEPYLSPSCGLLPPHLRYQHRAPNPHVADSILQTSLQAQEALPPPEPAKSRPQATHNQAE